MTLVMVSRLFVDPAVFDEIQARETAGSWCLELHRVRFLRTYFSLDRKRMLCLYDAPDAEAVRVAQRTIAMPVERIWPVSVLGAVSVLGESTAQERVVIIEREFEEPISDEALTTSMNESAFCFETHRSSWKQSYVDRGRTGVTCVFEAVDAESVRIANRQAGMPARAVWPATVHHPDA